MVRIQTTDIQLNLLNTALLVLYVPMAAVGYFELGEMARWVTLVTIIVIMAIQCNLAMMGGNMAILSNVILANVTNQNIAAMVKANVTI